MASSITSETSAVYVSYDVNNPPAHPGPSWTRFVCISDTHSRTYPVPPGDVLLHAGDLSSWGALKQLQMTLDWLKTLPHPAKILIGGNHDLCLDDEWREGGEWHRLGVQALPSKEVTAARRLIRSNGMREAGIHYLEHEALQVTVASGRTWKIYGSPAAPRYAVGAFQYLSGEGSAIYARIPPATEILLTHTPPHGILDHTRRAKDAGCVELLTRLESEDLRKCRLHVFGHIHEAHGACIDSEGGGRVSVNAALPHDGQAVIVDLKN